MNRVNFAEIVDKCAATASILLIAVSMATAQSTTTNTNVTPVKPVPVRRARVAASKSAGQGQPAAPVASQASTPGGQSATSMGQSAISAIPGAATSANAVNGQSAPAQQFAGGSQTGDTRPAVGLQGLGTFLFGDATLTVYGCFRTGTRVLCDFDLSKRRNAQLNAPWVWRSVELIDDGGKVTRIHTGFFVGQDGSQFPTAYVGSDPVRMIMEYDDVAANFTSVALVSGRNRIQGVPITAGDASQPAGSIPRRGAAPAPAGGSSKQ
jgi:hypothetical protein